MKEDPSIRHRLAARTRSSLHWLTRASQLRFLAALFTLGTVSTIGLLGGMALTALTALLAPSLFEGIGLLFLDRIPALFVALPLGILSGGLLAASILGGGLALLLARWLWKRLGFGLRLRAAWSAGKDQAAVDQSEVIKG